MSSLLYARRGGPTLPCRGSHRYMHRLYDYESDITMEDVEELPPLYNQNLAAEGACGSVMDDSGFQK